MSVSSIANLFSFFTPSKPPPTPPLPKAPFLQLSTDSHPSSSSSRPNQQPLFPLVSNNDSNQNSSSNSDITSVVCPSLAYANTLFYKGPHNTEIFVDEDEPEDQIVGRFRREVMRAGVIQEIKRRKFFENRIDKAKRKQKEAALRNRRRRGPPRDFEDFDEPSENNRDPEDENDNWEYTYRGVY